jgi:peptide/nickel transport system permease protein
MFKFVVKRLIAMIPVVLAVTFVVFTIMWFVPGDPTNIILGNEWSEAASAKLKAELGLDQPFLVQFFHYTTNLVQGDFGMSYITRAPVREQLMARFSNTLEVVAGAMLFCVGVGVPIGVYSGVRPYSLFSNFTMVAGLLGISFPIFWLGLLLILLFSVYLRWLPSSGLDDGFASLILPSLALGSNYMANIMRITRSSMLEVIRQDYIRTAKAKGVTARDVVVKHALQNSMMPTITVIGMDVGTLLGGVVLTETVFSIPGTGRLLVESINKRDTPTVLGCLVIMAVCIAISNLLVDIVYAYVDPRIKAQYGGGKD